MQRGKETEMEKATFHDHLELIYECFGKEAPFITLNQAAKFLHKDRRTLEADKTFPLKKLGSRLEISKIQLARWMSA